MKRIRFALKAAGGCVLAALLGWALSVWGFSGEIRLNTRPESFPLSLSGVGGALALLTALAFAAAWTGVARRTGSPVSAGTRLNAAGFGLLPGIAVWKAFEQESFLNVGAVIPREIPRLPWWTADGATQPGRIEMTLALLCFAAVVCWLALRREAVPENGDLSGVCLTLWGTARLGTAAWRGELSGVPQTRLILACTGAAMMAAALIIWVLRAFRRKQNTGYAAACVPVFAAGATVVILQGQGILTINPAADTAIGCACALLAMKAVICMGRITRLPLQQPVTVPPGFSGPVQFPPAGR